jgi:steroid delta-isomerase-like uncharacterized protein
MSEQNKSAVRRVIEEVWNRGNATVVDDLVANDYIGHAASLAAGGTQGPEGYKQFFADQRRAFSDIHYTVEDLVAEGDRVAVRWTALGTHTGVFQGLPPTGKHGQVTGTSFFRVANGKLVECWTQMDELGMLQQLGVIPTLGPAGS